MKSDKYSSLIRLKGNDQVFVQSFDKESRMRRHVEFKDQKNAVTDKVNQASSRTSCETKLTDDSDSSQLPCQKLTAQEELNPNGSFCEIEFACASDDGISRDDEAVLRIGHNKYTDSQIKTVDQRPNIMDNITSDKVTCESRRVSTRYREAACLDLNDTETCNFLDKMYQQGLLSSDHNIEDSDGCVHDKSCGTVDETQSENQTLTRVVPEKISLFADEESDVNNSAGMRCINHYFNYCIRPLASRNSSIGLLTCDKMFSDNLVINVNRLNRPERTDVTLEAFVDCDFNDRKFQASFCQSQGDQCCLAVRSDQTASVTLDPVRPPGSKATHADESNIKESMVPEPEHSTPHCCRKRANGWVGQSYQDKSGPLSEVDGKRVQSIRRVCSAKESCDSIRDESKIECISSTHTMDKGETYTGMFRFPFAAGHKADRNSQCEHCSQVTENHLFINNLPKKVRRGHLISELQREGTRFDKLSKAKKRRKIDILRRKVMNSCIKKSARKQLHSMRSKYLSDAVWSQEPYDESDCENLFKICSVARRSSFVHEKQYVDVRFAIMKLKTRTKPNGFLINTPTRSKRKFVQREHANFSLVRRGKVLNLHRLTSETWNANLSTNFQSKPDTCGTTSTKKQEAKIESRGMTTSLSCRCPSGISKPHDGESTIPRCTLPPTVLCSNSIGCNYQLKNTQQYGFKSSSNESQEECLRYGKSLENGQFVLECTENRAEIRISNKYTEDSKEISFRPATGEQTLDNSRLPIIWNDEGKMTPIPSSASRATRSDAKTESLRSHHPLANCKSQDQIQNDIVDTQTAILSVSVEAENGSNSGQWANQSRTLRRSGLYLCQSASYKSSTRKHESMPNQNLPTNTGILANTKIGITCSVCVGVNETTPYNNCMLHETFTSEKSRLRFADKLKEMNRDVSSDKSQETSRKQILANLKHPTRPDCLQQPFFSYTERTISVNSKAKSFWSAGKLSALPNVYSEWLHRSSWMLASSNSFAKEPTLKWRSSSDRGFTAANFCTFVNIEKTFQESEEVCNKIEADISWTNSQNISWRKEPSLVEVSGVPCRNNLSSRLNHEEINKNSTCLRRAVTFNLRTSNVSSQFDQKMLSNTRISNFRQQGTSFDPYHDVDMERSRTVLGCGEARIDAILRASLNKECHRLKKLTFISDKNLTGETLMCSNVGTSPYTTPTAADSCDGLLTSLQNRFEDEATHSSAIITKEHSLDKCFSVPKHQGQPSTDTGHRLLYTANRSHMTSNQRAKLQTRHSRRRTTVKDLKGSEASQRRLNVIATSSLIQIFLTSSIRKKIKSVKERGWRMLFLLLTLLSFVSVGSACPTACNCKWKGGKMTVECVNKGLKNLPEHLDHETQVLDFAGNSLEIIAREKFKALGLTNLQRIYVSRCKLEQLDDAAFRGLSNLVELDLSNNKLTMVPVAALEHAPALMRLQLSHNPITKIMDGSFSKLKSLITLEMTGCALQVMEPRAFQGLDKLEWLKLDDNQLKSVPETMLLPKMLHGVDLHNNPWHCDCKLQHLRSWLVKYNVPSSIEPKCSSPMRLESRTIKHVLPEDFACAPEVRPTSLFLDVLEGKNVSFACHVVAEPSADIEWKFNGYPLQNSSFIYDDSSSFYIYEDREVKEETVSHLKIEMVTEAHSGVFQCSAENTAGRMISNFTLRVSVPPTEPVPKDFIEDNFKYVGMALAGLIVLVVALCCILICKCCRRKSRRSAKKTGNHGNNIADKDKERQTGPISSMPKYIQMGTPTPKSNGISSATAPISVIEASPYRSSPAGAPHPNPDLISDSPVEEKIKPKKKVSILGVEEVDPNGIVTTRKLDDIVEEYEDSFVCQYDQGLQKNKDYESAQDLLNPPYSNISSCRIIANANPYPLMDIPSDDLQRQNLSTPNNQHYDLGGDYHGDNYGMPKDDTWLEMNGNRVSDYCNMKNNHSAPAYATMRRNNNTKHNGISANNLVCQQKYPEEYPMQSTGSPYQAPDGRYLQSYGGLIVEKYQSNGTSPTTASTSLTGCDCCPDQKSCELADAGGRMSGDGCSFDNLLGSCSGGVSTHCCYPETSGGRMFDNSLPENYAALTTPELQDQALFSAGPLPPEGWRDSDCMNGDCASNDCVKDNNQTPWDNMPLSPGTRVLYSPEDGFTNVVHCTSDTDKSRQSMLQQQQKSGESLPPATQV